MSDTQKAEWTDAVAGAKATVRYIPTGEEFTTTVHLNGYGTPSILGWFVPEAGDMGPEDLELLAVQKPQPALPTINGSVIKRNDTQVPGTAHLIAGNWTYDDGQEAIPASWSKGFSVVHDAGKENS
jgi:hypothetical protein